MTVLEDQANDWPRVVHSTELSQRTVPTTSDTPDLSDHLAVSQPILVDHAVTQDVGRQEKMDSTVYIAFVTPEHIFVLDLRIEVRCTTWLSSNSLCCKRLRGCCVL